MYNSNIKRYYVVTKGRQMTKTRLEALMEMQHTSWAELGRATKISPNTLRDTNGRDISTWKVVIVNEVAKYFNQNPGDFLNYLQGHSRINGIDINEIEQSIQGVKISNKMQFNLMINVIENNLNLGYLPTKEDIEYLLDNWEKIDKADVDKVHQKFLDQCKLQLAQINLQNK